ncbi:MAG TPA: response regulator transcription factor [Candidatus Paceibacterota bacterium]|nr:response regulator transcription factor [Candidatus Paceibacterota bacterium]
MKTDATIFVVDDDASMRKSLLWLLRSAGWHAEAYASAEEFLARPPFIGTGCLVLDVRMPHLTGPDLRDRLAACQSSLPIIFLTGHGDVPTGVDAMKKGAVDFLLKPVDDQVLLQAVQRAVEQHQRAQGHAREMGIIRERLARLSAREREVLEYVIAGCLNKQIADALGIAQKTIKIHRGRVMEKMEVSSVAGLVHLCETAGIAPRRQDLTH